MLIRFSAAEEFAAELAADLEHVERRIVRVTKLFRPLQPPWHAVTVVATAAITGHIVRLERRVGEVLDLRSPMEADRKTLERADQVAGELERRCQEIGLVVRAGVIEP